MSINTFSKFIEDKDFLFSANTNYTQNGVVDVKLQTNGLLAQIFELCGVVNYNNLSENIKDTIFDLHSNLSRGIDKNGEKITKIKEALDLIDLAIT